VCSSDLDCRTVSSCFRRVDYERKRQGGEECCGITGRLLREQSFCEAVHNKNCCHTAQKGKEPVFIESGGIMIAHEVNE
jgi:hypothetical protein